MNLIQELEDVLFSPTSATTDLQDLSYVLWRLFPVIQEMAKRIEELEASPASEKE